MSSREDIWEANKNEMCMIQHLKSTNKKPVLAHYGQEGEA